MSFFCDDLFLKRKIATSEAMPNKMATINIIRLLAAYNSVRDPCCVLAPAKGNLNKRNKVMAASKSQSDCIRWIMNKYL